MPITLITGVMGSGKTEKLIEIYKKRIKDKKECLVIKNKLDTRHKEISSRNGTTIPYDLIIEPENSLSIEYFVRTKGYFDSIFIDECQFYRDDLFDILDNMNRNKNLEIIVSGLLYDSNHRFFEVTRKIKDIALNVIENFIYCKSCGEAKATHIKKLIQNNDIILVGDDIYKSVCKSCYDSIG